MFGNEEDIREDDADFGEEMNSRDVMMNPRHAG